MAFDAHKNLAVSAVLTPPTPATTGTTLGVTAGHGARFPAVPFNATVWLSSALPDPTTAEVVRVTARSGDTLTITRAQEGSTARTILVGDLIAATVTAKALTDVESGANFPLVTTPGVVTASAVTTAGMVTASALAVGTTPAQSGVVRVPNNGGIVARDAANVADVSLLYLHPTLGVQLGAPVSAPTQPACAVTRTASQSVPQNTWTDLAFDTEVTDVGNCFTPAAPTLLTAPAQAAGFYLAFGEVAFASNAAGNRYVQIVKNGNIGLTIVIAAAFQGDITSIQVRCLATLAVGDSLSLRAYQNTTAPLGVTGNMQMVKLW